jgi:nucleotide-binding universal stress UspA family protein
MAGAQREFRILAGIDRSARDHAILATLMEAPWPNTARVRAITVREARRPRQLWAGLPARQRTADDAADRARRTLARRWPDAEAIVVDNDEPIEGVLTEARRFFADVIAVGWRGHGPRRRLLMGSVSRGVIRGATCAVLVVRRRSPRRIRNIVVAFDDSRDARRAVSMVAKLSPARAGRVTLVGVATVMVPTARGPVRALRRINTQRYTGAMRALNRAAEKLDRAGWRTRIRFRIGEPVRELMDAVESMQAELLVLGATGRSGVPHLLLGSVAEGALGRSPVPVLLVR